MNMFHATYFFGNEIVDHVAWTRHCAITKEYVFEFRVISTIYNGLSNDYRWKFSFIHHLLVVTIDDVIFLFFKNFPSSRKHFLAATKQLYEWFSPSVCPSVRPSVRPSVCLSVTPFWLCSHHRIIMKFSGVITSDKSDVHAKGQGQRSKVKVTEVTTQLNRFRTVTPVWIHMWWWNDAYSLIMLRRGALLFFKVIRQISRSHGSKNRRIWPRLGISGL